MQTIETSIGPHLRYNHRLIVDEERGEITVLLSELKGGAPDAEARLLALVYAHLKRLARGLLRNERSDLTLQASDLVHETYIKMCGACGDLNDRAHYFRVAAQAMRRVLVDHARAHRSRKRGNGQRGVPLDDAQPAVADAHWDYVIEFDRLLSQLSEIDERQARIVELRFYAGLSTEEMAEVLGCSSRTVKRDWQMAEAFLKRELKGRGD